MKRIAIDIITIFRKKIAIDNMTALKSKSVIGTMTKSRMDLAICKYSFNDPVELRIMMVWGFALSTK